MLPLRAADEGGVVRIEGQQCFGVLLQGVLKLSQEQGSVHDGKETLGRREIAICGVYAANSYIYGSSTPNRIE